MGPSRTIRGCNDGLGPLYGVPRLGDTIFVTGALQPGGFDDLAWTAALTLDGAPVWDGALGIVDRFGYFIEPDPDTDGVLVAGLSDVGSDEEQWGLRCDAQGCDPMPLEVNDMREFHGFAIDGRGHWLVAMQGRLEARIPGGDIAWTYDADFFQSYHEQSSVLAVDSTGAILLGGTDGVPTLVKLTPVGD